ncbi:MAG TPA: aldo/keto reductase, partial [Anaerolineales bacterium]
RPDPETPLEETMGALDYVVRSGRALYVGISQYPPELTRRAAAILRDLGTPCLIHQPNYSLLDRWIENGLLDTLSEEGIGCIVFSPLAQGLLTDRYLKGIPADSRAARPSAYLHREDVDPKMVSKVSRLNEVAAARGQTMAQMAIAWVLRQPAVTSALVGASRPKQIEDTVAALDHLEFKPEELAAIEAILEEA